MDPNVTAAREEAQSLGTQAVDYASRGNTLADELRKAIGERYAQSSFATDAAKARSDFLSAGPQARSDVAGLVQSGSILSPSQQAAILAAKRGEALIPLTGSNLIQQAVFGTMDDLIGAGTRAWQAQTDRLSGLAGLAQTNYSNLLNEMIQNAQLEQQRREEARAAELFPLQKQKLQADIASVGRGGGAYNKQIIQLGDQAYYFDPRTGELTPTGISTGSGGYDENDIAGLANAVAEEQITLKDVPAEIQGDVATTVAQIEASKGPSLLERIGRFLNPFD